LRAEVELSDDRAFRRLEPILVGTTVALGLVHTWAGRYSMSPDGMSYLDVGSAFVRHDWFGAFNGYWSPLYAWIEGAALGLTKPSERWEFPAAHLVNFCIFLAVLLGFRFLLGSCLKYRRWILSDTDERAFLADWAVTLLSYPIFWWASFELMPLYEIGPDLMLSACLYAAAGLLLNAKMALRRREFVLLGLVLGIGYWVKAPFFLLSLVTLAIAYLWGRSRPEWRSGMVLASVAFLVTASPLIFVLSLQKHRPTFGDSARLNYAWFIAPQTFHRNWQGMERGSGKPLHPTHQVLREPPVYTFEGPVVGTYPPWLDPSYWNEGLQPHFALKAQIRALVTDLLTEAGIGLRAQPALLSAVLLLLALGGAKDGLRVFWPFVAIGSSAFVLYAPVHVEPRFLGGFVVLLFLTPILGSRLRIEDLRAAQYLAIAVFVVMALGACDTAFRFLTLRPAVAGNGPAPALNDVMLATRMHELGLHPGESVAMIGDGSGAYWARLAKLRITAEVMAADHDAQRFWRSSLETQSSVLHAFALSGARAVFADSPPIPPGTEWSRIEGTNYYMRMLASVEDK